ncbi:MAG: hypothetical protein U0807_17560 [Candidatus Binatia bacterium]
MPATVVTKEAIAADVDAAGLQRERSLRLKAGAIRTWVDVGVTGARTLCTEWNVIGEE